MNNLVFGNQDAEKIAASVEEIVRKDVGSGAPLNVRTTDVAAVAGANAAVASEINRVFAEGSASTLTIVEVDLAGAMPGSLAAQVLRQGVGGFTGPLVFVVPLGKPIGGAVGIEDHKSFGTPKFTGDPAAAGRLNGVKDLAKRVDKALRTETDMGTGKVKIPRTFAIVPSDGGSTLAIGSLPRLTSMGMSATTDAKDMLEIAAAIQASL